MGCREEVRRVHESKREQSLGVSTDKPLQSDNVSKRGGHMETSCKTSKRKKIDPIKDQISWLLIFYKFLSWRSSLCLIRSLHPVIFPICDSIMHSPAVWLFSGAISFSLSSSVFPRFVHLSCLQRMSPWWCLLQKAISLTQSVPLFFFFLCFRRGQSFLCLPYSVSWRTPPHLSHALSPSQNYLPHWLCPSVDGIALMITSNADSFPGMYMGLPELSLDGIHSSLWNLITVWPFACWHQWDLGI